MGNTVFFTDSRRGQNKQPEKVIFPSRNWVYIDVDGCLLIDGKINKTLSEWIVENSQRNGGKFYLVLWSAAGKKHAFAVSGAAGLNKYFEAILAKPSHIIDDHGTSWVKWVKDITKI